MNVACDTLKKCREASKPRTLMSLQNIDCCSTNFFIDNWILVPVRPLPDPRWTWRRSQERARGSLQTQRLKRWANKVRKCHIYPEKSFRFEIAKTTRFGSCVQKMNHMKWWYMCMYWSLREVSQIEFEMWYLTLRDLELNFFETRFWGINTNSQWDIKGW